MIIVTVRINDERRTEKKIDHLHRSMPYHEWGAAIRWVQTLQMGFGRLQWSIQRTIDRRWVCPECQACVQLDS